MKRVKESGAEFRKKRAKKEAHRKKSQGAILKYFSSSSGSKATLTSSVASCSTESDSSRDVLASAPTANRERGVSPEKHSDAFAPRRGANKSNLLRRRRSRGTTSTQFQVARPRRPARRYVAHHEGSERRELGTKELSS